MRKKILDQVKIELSVQEEYFVRQSLATRAILSPKLLIKDHNTSNKKWGFPTRLVIPVKNFTTTFSKIGYLWIKRMLDKVIVNYSRISIVQASERKERLEELKVKRDEVIIGSVDAIIMYPSIKLLTIRKEVRFLARTFTAATKKTNNLCVELICLIMSSTFIYFDGEYHEYHGGEREEQGLEICGYESAFLVDMVESYLFEKSKANLHPTTYH